MAPLGDAPRLRGRPLHPQISEDMVIKPHGRVSTDNVLQLLEYQHHRCALTGRQLTPDTSSLDHIVPIRCGGEHLIENTQVLHSNVNRAKGSLTNAEFIQLCREVAAHTARQDFERSNDP